MSKTYLLNNLAPAASTREISPTHTTTHSLPSHPVSVESNGDTLNVPPPVTALISFPPTPTHQSHYPLPTLSNCRIVTLSKYSPPSPTLPPALPPTISPSPQSSPPLSPSQTARSYYGTNGIYFASPSLPASPPAPPGRTLSAP